ncbi:MAG: DUF952 domain-containing protein [Pseudomonadota bacterium]
MPMLNRMIMMLGVTLITACSPQITEDDVVVEAATHSEHPYLFHLVQADLWEPAMENDVAYFPPTYEQDGFTHATANPDLLLNVANHFYTDVPGKWWCLRMTVDSLEQAGTKVVFEGTAPVGDIEPNFEGTDDELFPHILGGIRPAAVLEVHEVSRAADGTFLSVAGVTAKIE